MIFKERLGINMKKNILTNATVAMLNGTADGVHTTLKAAQYITAGTGVIEAFDGIVLCNSKKAKDVKRGKEELKNASILIATSVGCSILDTAIVGSIIKLESKLA